MIDVSKSFEAPKLNYRVIPTLNMTLEEIDVVSRTAPLLSFIVPFYNSLMGIENIPNFSGYKNNRVLQPTYITKSEDLQKICSGLENSLNV